MRRLSTLPSSLLLTVSRLLAHAFLPALVLAVLVLPAKAATDTEKNKKVLVLFSDNRYDIARS